MFNEELLLLQNPWWRPNFRPESMQECQMRHRFVFSDITKALRETRLMIQIKGLRRLGKSTLMKQLIIELLEKEKVAPQKIFFIEFSSLSSDLGYILKNAPKDGYLFLDEIQNCENWKDILKQYYDLHAHGRIVFSGSATMGYTAEKESLLGRFLPIDTRPLGFKEYLFLKYGDCNKRLFYNQAELFEYMEYGEFPELLNITDAGLKKQYLQRSILEPLFTTDVSLYSVEKKTEFSVLFKSLITNTGQMLNKQALGADIGISRPLVDKYIAILEDMGLIKTITNYYKSVRKALGSDKKIYSTSINLTLAQLGIINLPNFSLQSFKGHIFENFVFNELSRTNNAIYYWKRKNMEIDFIVDLAGQKIAYEVKAKQKISQHEIDMYRRRVAQVGADFQMILWDISKENTPLAKIL